MDVIKIPLALDDVTESFGSELTYRALRYVGRWSLNGYGVIGKEDPPEDERFQDIVGRLETEIATLLMHNRLHPLDILLTNLETAGPTCAVLHLTRHPNSKGDSLHNQLRAGRNGAGQ